MAKTRPPHPPNGIGYFDIAGPNVSALRDFYSAVFKWSIDPQGVGCALVRTPDGSVDGALVEQQTASLTIGVVVPDLAGALRAAERNAGEVVMPATDNGWVTKAQLRDPAGNVITLIQEKNYGVPLGRHLSGARRPGASHVRIRLRRRTTGDGRSGATLRLVDCKRIGPPQSPPED